MSNSIDKVNDKSKVGYVCGFNFYCENCVGDEEVTGYIFSDDENFILNSEFMNCENCGLEFT